MKRDSQITRVVVSLILILAFGVNLTLSSVSTVSAELTNDTIKAKEKEIADAQKEKKAIQSSLSDIKKIKAQLEQSKADLSTYITELDNQVADLQTKIEDLSNQISEKETQIKTTEAELEEALAEQNAQYEAMKLRIKFMYEKGNQMYIDLMLRAGSFSDALNKAEYIESLSAYDKRMLDQYVEYSEYVALCKEALEEEKKVLDETQAAQEEEQKNLNALIEDKQAEINQVGADINNKEAAIAEYQAELAAQDEAIKALEAAVAEEKKKLAAEQARKYDGGIFTHPCPGYKRVSDDYGMRMHPTLGVEKMHNGIDFAASAGTPIYAAYDGKVVAATYSSSMGNYVMIDHGDSLYTVYMHASALYVSKGQEVSRGQKIAAVGTTGRSTGNHLHFSVRKNGNYVSPWPYLG